MRVFVTGGSGHIGSSVIPELLGAGHEVLALARSEASAAGLAAAGVDVRRGDLDDPNGLRDAISACDGVIHLAFKHEAMLSGDYQGAVDADLNATKAMSEALVGTGKPFVTSSGTLMLTFAGLQRTGVESDAVESGPRVDAENLVIGLAQQGVRSSAIRLPPTVHSSLDHHGFVPTLISVARDKGVSGYVGDGTNRWPAGNTLDVARLYKLALEKAPGGSRLHAVGDEGIPLRDIAAAIGRGLNLPMASIAPEDAEAHFGSVALVVQLDNPTSSALTQELLDWHPEQPGLIADLGLGHYFQSDNT